MRYPMETKLSAEKAIELVEDFFSIKILNSTSDRNEFGVRRILLTLLLWFYPDLVMAASVAINVLSKLELSRQLLLVHLYCLMQWLLASRSNELSASSM